MCGAGQEGIISKRADAAYSGRRSKNWVKVKCTRRQEFILVGWNSSSTKARPFASLLLAPREGDAVDYMGNVATVFDTETMAALAKKLDSSERKTDRNEVGDVQGEQVPWQNHELVANITPAG